VSIVQVNKVILVTTPNKFYYYVNQTPKLRAYPLAARAGSLLRLSGLLVCGCGCLLWLCVCVCVGGGGVAVCVCVCGCGCVCGVVCAGAVIV
jgi:hypothetical protein